MERKSIIIIIAALIYSCNSKKETTKMEIQNINKVWMLVSFKNFSKEDLVKKNAFLDLTNSERATAKMGCNNLSFAYKVSGETITFSQGIATRIYCSDMNLENSFSKEILLYNEFKIDGHKLVLSNASGEKIEFVAQDWD